MSDSPDRLKIKFKEAARSYRTLAQKASGRSLDSKTKLRLYALYKQSTVGQCNYSKPSILQFWKSRRKWEAWNSLGPISKSEAMNEYIRIVEDIDNSDNRIE